MDLRDRVARFLVRENVIAFLTGGSARDTLLNRPTHDLDLTVVGSAAPLARKLADELDAAFYVLDPEFDVARVVITSDDGSHTNIDFARQRGERIEDDLATRDFSINAMALPLANGQWLTSVEAIIDPFGGLYDLAVSAVRAIDDKVFQNDPVRLMRAPRMAITLGFNLAEETIQQIQRDSPLLERGAAERVRDELLKILAADNTHRNLEMLRDLGLLVRVLPELGATREVMQSPPHIHNVFEHSLYVVAAVEDIQRAEYAPIANDRFGAQLKEHFAREISSDHTRGLLLRLGALLHDIGKPVTHRVEDSGRIRFIGHEDIGAEVASVILNRLRFSNEETKYVHTILSEHLRPLLLSQQPVLSNRAVYRFFRDTGDAGLDICVHAWADQHAKSSQDENEEIALQRVVEQLLTAYFHQREQVVVPPSLITGRDVMELLKIGEGPRVGEILNAVREAQAEGSVNNREGAISFIRQLQE